MLTFSVLALRTSLHVSVSEGRGSWRPRQLVSGYALHVMGSGDQSHKKGAGFKELFLET